MLLMLCDGQKGQSVRVSAMAAGLLLVIDRLTACRPLPGLSRSSRLHKHEHQKCRRSRQESQHKHGATVAVVRVVRERSNKERPCIC